MIFVVVSTGHFDALIDRCNMLRGKYDFIGQIGSSTVIPDFVHFKTAEPPKIEAYMKDAEIVVSHGGAGMTAMIYRFRKKSVIIPKQKRYGEANDLQVELARKWGELGMGVFCLDVLDLDKSIELARKLKFNFPEFPSLGEHVKGAMGYAPENPQVENRKHGS